MIIYPDRDMKAALTLFKEFGPQAQARDAQRMWGETKGAVEKLLIEGKVAVMMHDGAGTREAVKPNIDSWLIVAPFKDEHRGCELYYFDGPSPERAYMLIERDQLDGPNVRPGKTSAELRRKGGRL